MKAMYLWAAAVLGLPAHGLCGQALHYCATREYVAIADPQDYEGATLWVGSLPSTDDEPIISKTRLAGQVRALACGDTHIYVRQKSAVLAAEWRAQTLEAGPITIGWGQIPRAKLERYGRIRPGRMYTLPNMAFSLALTKAKHDSFDDELNALFLVGPRAESLMFSRRYLTITVDCSG
jgi:hypothetical protein